MIFEIPLFPDIGAVYRESIILDEKTYVLRFRFNTRAEAWFMDIFEEDMTPIVFGRRIVVDMPLLFSARYRTSAPPGELLAFDTSRRRLDPEVIEDFGTRVILAYLDEIELAS